MAKYSGSIGYVETKETSRGVHVEVPTERAAYGNVIGNVYRSQETEHLNADIRIGNSFSVLMDAYAISNFHNIRYLTWMDSRWSIREVKKVGRRLHIQIGGLYNGPIPEPENEETPAPDPLGGDTGVD